MTSIQIPFRSRDESLVDVAGHAWVLGQGDDRAAVARQIAISALMDGTATSAGELLDHLDQLAPAERRALLDQARLEVGLPSTSEVDARRRVQGINRVELVQGLQRCHGPDCSAIPTTSTGSWALVNVARWHCPAHVHLADPGDMDDLGIGVRYSENGVLVPDDPAADARAAAEAESRHAQQQTRQADRERDAAAAHEHQAALAEQVAREVPPGVPS